MVRAVFKKHLQEIYHARIAYPAKKKEVGERLAALALNRDYGMWAIPCYSPEAVKCTRFSSCELAVELTDCPNGLSRWMETMESQVWSGMS